MEKKSIKMQKTFAGKIKVVQYLPFCGYSNLCWQLLSFYKVFINSNTINSVIIKILRKIIAKGRYNHNLTKDIFFLIEVST